jgi:dTMP kinase
MSKNPFIVIEALDAGGSQTQTNLLAERLRSKKYQVLQLHFPQEDRATGRFIYNKFLLSKNKQKLSRREQALLYIQDFYSRAEDIAQVIDTPGRHVALSDRFYGSTLAYQMLNLSGKQRAAMQQWLMGLIAGTPALPKPDLVIFLDTPVEVSLARLKDKKKDFFETRQKLTDIRRSYRMVAQDQSWHIINSVDNKGEQRTREDLHEKVWLTVAPLIAQK